MQRRNVERLAWAQRGDRRLDMVLYGDSISSFHFGYTVNSNVPGTTTYWKRSFGDTNSVVLAIPGDSIGNLVWRLMEGNEKPAQSPRVVAILIGINDLLRFGENLSVPRVPSTTRRLMYLLNMLHAKVPHAKLLVCGLTPTADPGLVMRRLVFNAVARATVDRYRKLGWSILYVETLASGSLRDGILADRVHLTHLGQQMHIQSLRRAYDTLLTM